MDFFLSTDYHLTRTDTGLVQMISETPKGLLWSFLASIVHTQRENLHNRIQGLHRNTKIKTFVLQNTHLPDMFFNA